MSDNDRSWNAINSFLIFAVGLSIGFLVRPYLLKCPIENTTQCTVTVQPKAEAFKSMQNTPTRLIRQQVRPYGA